MKFTFNINDIQEEVLRCGLRDIQIDIDYNQSEED